jgi:transcriptional regulator with XRE-family HTH domain
MADLPALNATALRNLMAQRGLRQWWLAEQLGVDRRTVLRWVNGQVRQVQPAQLQALARVLGCAEDALRLHEPNAQLATADDQRAAGQALVRSQLLDRMGAIGEWDVVEQLLKASAVPDLPLPVLGRLYHQLCVACWRQDKLALAATHNGAALDIARRCDDRALLADALGSRANLQFWAGDMAAAQASWQDALALSPWIGPRERGALHSNLGAALLETGQAASGQVQLRQALDCFDSDGTPMNHSIAHAHLALAALALDDTDAAARHAAHSATHAQAGDYRRGQAFAPLLHAVVAARRGQPDAAQDTLAQSQEAFAALGIDEALNHRLAAQVWRLLGDASAARTACQQALQRAAGFPFEQAAAQAEWQRIQAMSPCVTGQGDGPALP